MLDSSAKSTAGIEFGQLYQLGHFDQCMSINGHRSSSQAGILSQYCLANVRLDSYFMRTVVSRIPKTNETALVHWGICSPASCSEEDVIRLLQSISGSRDVTISGDGCHREAINPLSSLDIVYVSVIMFFVLMVVLSTLYHVRLIYGPRSEKTTTLVHVLRSFSILENLKKLAQDSKDDHGLGCINGIKAVAMFFILSGHALLFQLGDASYNPGFYYEVSSNLQTIYFSTKCLTIT